ncbi:unnamed protein product [Knipowitschia caucasica]
MASTAEPEVQFAQRLASNEKPVRRKALKKLRGYLNARSRTQSGFSEEELLKLWKGLFYCLWMQDKPLLQEELSTQISGLLHHFHNYSSQLLFFQTFLTTMKREWTGIDRLRMDKYFQLVRFVFRHMFELLQKSQWDPSQIDLFLDLVWRELLHTGAPPVGLQLHVLDLYLRELAVVGAHELSADQNLAFIQPFMKTAAKTKDRTLFSAICSSVFSNIIDQAPFAIQELLEELDQLEQDSDSGQASDEQDEAPEDLKSRAEKAGGHKPRTSSKAPQTNGTNTHSDDDEEEEDDDDDDDDEDEDDGLSVSEQPCDPDMGPILQFDYGAVADKLLELSSRGNTPTRNRQRLYRIVRVLRDLSQGSFPQDEYPEEVSTDEDDEDFGSRKRLKRRPTEEEAEAEGPKVKKPKVSKKTTTDSNTDNSEQAKKKKKKKKKKKPQSPTEPSQVQAEPSEPSPVQAEPSEQSPVQAEPSEQSPVQAEPSEQSPVQAEPSEQSLVQAEPSEPSPVQAEPSEPSQVQAEPEPEPASHAQDNHTPPQLKKKKIKKAKKSNLLNLEQNGPSDPEASAPPPDPQSETTAPPVEEVDTSSSPAAQKNKKKKKKGAAISEQVVKSPEAQAEELQAHITAVASPDAGVDQSQPPISPATSTKGKKKRTAALKRAPQAAAEQDTGENAMSETAEPPVEEVDTSSSPAAQKKNKKRKKKGAAISEQVVKSPEAQAEELQAHITAVASPDAGVDQSQPPISPASATSTKGKKKRTAALKRAPQSAAEQDTGEKKRKKKIPVEFEYEADEAQVQDKAQDTTNSATPKTDSKKVRFGLKNNRTAEFRRTDRSLLLSPEGPSRVPFDPDQKPKCGVLKSPPTPFPKLKKKKSIVRQRPTAADFF